MAVIKMPVSKLRKAKGGQDSDPKGASASASASSEAPAKKKKVPGIQPIA